MPRQICNSMAVFAVTVCSVFTTSDKYGFNKRTGEITSTQLYDNQDKASKVRSWVYMLHVGSWGGMVTRILWFLVSLFGATLPITGYYLWIKRIYKQKH